MNPNKGRTPKKDDILDNPSSLVRSADQNPENCNVSKAPGIYLFN